MSDGRAGLNAEHLLSQCYDGAGVISGHFDGVQKNLQNEIGKSIPYVCWDPHLAQSGRSVDRDL